jgi:hypothetical protein
MKKTPELRYELPEDPDLYREKIAVPTAAGQTLDVQRKDTIKKLSLPEHWPLGGDICLWKICSRENKNIGRLVGSLPHRSLRNSR